MAKKATAQKQNNQSNTNWWVVGIALLALLVSLMAWNNSKSKQNAEYQNLQTQVKDLQQQLKMDQARQQLEVIRQDIDQKKNVEEMQSKIELLREDLRISFLNADEKARLYWQDVDKKLEELQAGLKEQSLNVLDTLDDLINKLKLEIMY